MRTDGTTFSAEPFIQIRRDLHRIPEIGFEETKTQAYILNYLERLACPFLEIKPWRTGILVMLRGDAPESTIGYRTDMDGLPMEEETGLSFASAHPGMMHACGHDLHMSIALGVLTYFSQRQPKENLLFVFQPAEEGPGGAKPMLASDEFRAWKPDKIVALHIAPELPAGTVATKPGLLFANTSELFINLTGKGGHAAYPHHANDMVVAASHLITQLHTVVSRNVSPLDSAVLTIGKISGGSKQNIIAEQARIEGTIRTLSTDSMQKVKQRIESIVAGIEQSFDCTSAIDYGANYCQVYNAPSLTEEFIRFVEKSPHASFALSEKAMTGEDFGYFLEEIPGFMFWLGVESEYGLHSSKLQPDERAIATAIHLLIDYLNK
ncbi:N-acetyldiaminopimelate deacetylase [Evansella caseinilytica]|uniref:N-acetyldiaminopimelate deacetylase n=1 Tax=Evansella caseinilytica TaxID=1503961 RepID=A0A1H3MQH2_9BACI|nr:N-acetyldiaminopimelate deacetylase [Evansella caseinilytica]SDY78901.1 N-acetyldiaminopimelate deacetylase [Evansella caseinilytica]